MSDISSINIHVLMSNLSILATYTLFPNEMAPASCLLASCSDEELDELVRRHKLPELGGRSVKIARILSYYFPGKIQVSQCNNDNNPNNKNKNKNKNIYDDAICDSCDKFTPNANMITLNCAHSFCGKCVEMNRKNGNKCMDCGEEMRTFAFDDGSVVTFLVK